MTTPYFGNNFSTMQTAGQARPPAPSTYPVSGTGGSAYSPYSGTGAYAQPSMDPYASQPSGAYSPGAQAPQTGGAQAPQPMQQSSVPNLSGMWSQLSAYGNNSYGAPTAQQSNYQPGSYRSPGTLNAYQGSNYQPPTFQNGANPIQAPGAPQQMYGPGAQGQFQNGQLGNATDQATFGSIMNGLANPSRYGAGEVGQAYNVLNNQLTQSGNADYKRINEDMANRGIYNSTTAGGYLGDLATNLNQQRSNFATNLATDQARTYGQDRSNAIQQALGYGNQQFGQAQGAFGANQAAQAQNYGQGLSQFGANQAAQGQNFGQGLQAGQFNQGLAQSQFTNNLDRQNFLLNQNQQNFGQQAAQYGANTQNAQNQYQAGLANANFGLNQTNQNYANSANQFAQQQGSNQQSFQQMLAALTGQQGYQQQGFNNQLSTQQTNNQQQQAYMQWLQQMYGQTA